MICPQINPLAETSKGIMMAADAKLNFDDNAAFRQKEIFAMRDTTQEDPREVRCTLPQRDYFYSIIILLFECECQISDLFWHITVFVIISLVIPADLRYIFHHIFTVVMIC